MNISVIVPVYNAEELLEKAVQSALQFSEVKEVLLIEDGSKDNSLEVCKKLKNAFPERIKLYQHENGQNKGAGASRNLGLKKATQDFIAFLDADDYYLPNRFDAERKLFQNPKIEGVFGAIGVDFISEKGKKEFQEKFKNLQLTTVNYPAEGIEVFNGLMGITEKKFGVFFSLVTLTIRKKSLEKHPLYFNENLRVHQDTDFIIRLAYHLHLSTGIIDRPNSMRGVHNDNRITKIKPYSAVFYKNMLFLSESLYIWSKTTKNLPKKIKKELKLKYISLKIANEIGVKKYFWFLYYTIQNPILLKTRYRFHALIKHKK